MKLALYCTPHFCSQWPKIKVILNNKEINTFEITEETPSAIVNLELEEQNNLEINYYNKKEEHTTHINGVILQDQYLNLDFIRIDNILIEPWVLTDGYYNPKYFAGYLKHVSNPEEKIKSQLIWHFPGIFSFPIFPKNFWDWYYEQKQSKEVIKFLDKDPDRINKFRGSLDPCTELVQKIKELI
jgi:hypothetical protein